MTLLAEFYSLIQARGLVAKALLDNIGNNSTAQHQLTQRNIAVLTGKDWETVHTSLKSLQDTGAIKIERNRMIINKELLQKIARITANVPNKPS